MTAFKVGDRVRWRSSNTDKLGVVVEVVPAGKRPLRDAGSARGQESYLVRGGGPRQKGSSLYWPLVSLLHLADGLSPDEIAWCHANADRVRALIVDNTAIAEARREVG